MLHEQPHGGLGGEHELAGQEPVGQTAGRINVGATVQISSHRLLGGNERRRTLDRVLPRVHRVRVRGVLDRPDNAEIQHFDEVVLLAVPADEDVRGFDVAMHQAARLGLGQRVTHLAQQVDGPFGRGWPEAPQ